MIVDGEIFIKIEMKLKRKNIELKIKEWGRWWEVWEDIGEGKKKDEIKDIIKKLDGWMILVRLWMGG